MYFDASTTIDVLLSCHTIFNKQNQNYILKTKTHVVRLQFSSPFLYFPKIINVFSKQNIQQRQDFKVNRDDNTRKIFPVSPIFFIILPVSLPVKLNHIFPIGAFP